MSLAAETWAKGHPVGVLVASIVAKAASPRESGMAHKRHRDALGQTGGRS